MSSLLQNFLNDQNCSSIIPLFLPSMHSTECFNAENIYNKNTLELRYCSKFQQNLLYFFYGKPTYKVAQTEASNRNDSLLSPVCFIVDTTKLPVKMILPFDSGAYISNLYKEVFPKEYLNKESLLDLYSIESLDVLQKFITIFYGNNENYLEGKCNINDDLASSQCAIEALKNLLTSNFTKEFDDRSRTAEIVCDSKVSLSKIAKAVIVPQNHLNNRSFKEFQKKYPQIKVIMYKTHYPLNPSLFNEAVFQKAYEYMEKEKFI